jgi:hypothetical protein
MRSEIISGVEATNPLNWKAGDRVRDLMGFSYEVAYVHGDGAFGVDGQMLKSDPVTRYHYDAGEKHPFRRALT